MASLSHTSVLEHSKRNNHPQCFYNEHYFLLLLCLIQPLQKRYNISSVQWAAQYGCDLQQNDQSSPREILVRLSHISVTNSQGLTLVLGSKTLLYIHYLALWRFPEPSFFFLGYSSRFLLLWRFPRPMTAKVSDIPSQLHCRNLHHFPVCADVNLPALSFTVFLFYKQRSTVGTTTPSVEIDIIAPSA